MILLAMIYILYITYIIIIYIFNYYIYNYNIVVNFRNNYNISVKFGVLSPSGHHIMR